MTSKLLRKSCLFSTRFISSNSTLPANLAYKLYWPIPELDETLAPVIFLHGAASSKESWNDIPQKVADTSKRVAYTLDARNHGESEWKDLMNFDCQVADAFHFMDTINASKAILVGHSMGGITATRMALKTPERVEKIILEDCSIRKLSAETLDNLILDMNLWREGLLNVPKDMSETDATKYVVNYVYNNLYPNKECLDKKAYLCNIYIPIKRTSEGTFDVKYNVDILTWTMKNPDILMRKPQGIYDGPAFICYGSSSPMKVYEDEELIRKHFPSVEMIKFERGKHNLHAQFPEKFTKVVIKCILQETQQI